MSADSRMPAYIHRGQVVRMLGIDYHAVDDLRVELKNGDEEVPHRKIGAVRGLSRRRGRAGPGYFLYRSSDVLRMVK